MNKLFNLAFPSEKTPQQYWGELSGSALTCAIAQAYNERVSPYLLICEDNAKANECLYELSSISKAALYHLCDLEILPYDHFSAHSDLISERINTLYQCLHLTQGIVVTSISTVMHRLCPPDYIRGRAFKLAIGDSLNLEEFREQLQQAGYQSVSQVLAHGEYVIRGSIIDLFPMGSRTPFRIDLFDDEVESIRTFDPKNQCSIAKIDHFAIHPRFEFPLDGQGIATFTDNWLSTFDDDQDIAPIYEDIRKGISPPGIEYYLPLFFKETATLFDYLPDNTLIFYQNTMENKGQSFWQEVHHIYENGRHDRLRPLLPPKQLFISVEHVHSAFKKFHRVQLNHHVFANKHAHALGAKAIKPHPQTQENPFVHLAKLHHGKRCLLVAETLGRKDALITLAKAADITLDDISSIDEFREHQSDWGIWLSHLTQGCEFADFVLLTEYDLFGERVMQRRARKKVHDDYEQGIAHLSELTIGMAVVHMDKGIGRYCGLTSITLDGLKQEFLTLEYYGGDKLYVPVTDLHLVSQYSGAPLEQAPLHRLGSGEWDKVKQKAQKKIHDVAAELLEIYAKRQAKKGFSHQGNELDLARFAAQFPFEETADQSRAIDETIADMQRSYPMDRLICGDVGFGKTEVAMRAAYTAVLNKKQVTMLVPTTLLAEQHGETFASRFAPFAVEVAVLSRFKSSKEQKVIADKLAHGKVDIVIGTHALLNPSIKYQDLGLLIIDEEHRFGVRQKERIKAFRTEVDLLSLTATPIPRTLNMALSKIRDLSIIATPPQKRLSIKTFVQPYRHSLIQEALQRELLRGGQVYFLHNEVRNINERAHQIEELLPQAKVAIAHGQLPEKELERVMTDFYHQRFNVLVCTTIIETGIDIPSANTIIIERADKFGLAQLHQLRGRVGRSHHQAYAYLLTPPPKEMTGDAHKRLEALEGLNDLGAGFQLAMQDLEIRGSGELLGQAQSGHVAEIGYTLYMTLLERAVKSLQSGELPESGSTLKTTTEIDLRLQALLPEPFIPDVHTRLVLYKRLSEAKTQLALNELKVELIDRFGRLPEAAHNLIEINHLRLKADQLGIKQIKCQENQGAIDFTAKPSIAVDALIKLVEKHPEQYRLAPNARLCFNFKEEIPQERISVVQSVLEQLTPNKS